MHGEESGTWICWEWQTGLLGMVHFISVKILTFKYFYFLRLIIKQGNAIISDSGYIYDNTMTGGKVGLFTFGQGNVIWSKLSIKCQNR